MSSILIWDCSTCQSDSIALIQQMSQMINKRFDQIILFSNEVQHIPDDASELTSLYSTTIRYGENALYDVIVDVVGFVSKVKSSGTVVLASSKIAIWLSMFQKYPINSLFIISDDNVEDTMELAFLPDSIDVQFVAWNNFQSGKRQVRVIKQKKEEEEPVQEVEEEYPHIDGNISGLSAMQAGLDSDSRTESDGLMDDDDSELEHQEQIYQNPQPPASKPRHDNDQIVIDMKYQPLIEAMKTIGKAMINLPVLTAQVKLTCQQLGLQEPNLSALISQASDEGIVIFDKSINYIRFKNRSLPNMQIVYE